MAVARLVEIMRDVLRTETTLPELIHNNTDFMVILSLGFINPVTVRESFISRLLMPLFRYDICMYLCTIYCMYVCVSEDTTEFTNWCILAAARRVK